MRHLRTATLLLLLMAGCGGDEKAASNNTGGSANGGSGGVAGSGGGGGGGGAGGGTTGGAAGSGGGATTIQFPDLALEASSSKLLKKSDGSAVMLTQGISCCGGGYGWPLVDHAWIDLMSQNGINGLHLRLGPWRTVAGGEDEWASVGGAYLEAGGLAELDQFNPAFWSAVEEILDYAGQKNMFVEVDVADGWGLKHAQWDDYGPNWPYHPWSAWNNTDGGDFVTDAGTLEIPAGSVWDDWVRKVAEHTCKYGNVILEDGNEVSLKQGYDAAWTQSIANVYWDECAVRGYLASGEVHRPLFGTNSGQPAVVAAPQVSYSQWHMDGPVDPSTCGGKPCGVNEYNPDPPLEPAELHANVCAARAAGTWFSYWRHGQSDQAMQETLALVAQGCGG